MLDDPFAFIGDTVSGALSGRMAMKKKRLDF
jgi:hypothetical protein